MTPASQLAGVGVGEPFSPKSVQLRVMSQNDNCDSWLLNQI